MMRKQIWIAGLMMAMAMTASAQQAPNTLSKKEVKEGWKLLFDGTDMKGWESAKGADVPIAGWEVKDGLFNVTDNTGEQGGTGGDVMTTAVYKDFELTAEFKITRGANSGIKYFVDPEKTGKSIGFEYQILDDAVHPDAKAGRNGDRTEGSLYDMVPAPANKPVKPVGEWNVAKIVVHGAHVEHWLNGVKVVDVERFTPEFRAIVAESKFHKIAGFGELHEGHILLQDHGFPVSFRSVKIRELP